MLRRVLGVVGVFLVIGLASALLAGCGGPPDFVPGPGKARISPLPETHGEVSQPANVTVDGTRLFIFTHGVRQLDQKFQLNVSAVPNPVPGTEPGDIAVQAWLGKGDSMVVAGLRVTVTAVYDRQGEGDVKVTPAASADHS